MTEPLAWEDPNASDVVDRYDWQAIMGQLQSEPERWARLDVFATQGKAQTVMTAIKKGRTPLPAAAVQVKSGRRDDGHRVWLRWLRPPGPKL